MHPLGSFPFGNLRRHLLKLSVSLRRETYYRPPAWQTAVLFPQLLANKTIERDLHVFFKPFETVFLPEIKVVEGVSEKQIQTFARCAPIRGIPWHMLPKFLCHVIKHPGKLGRVLFSNICQINVFEKLADAAEIPFIFPFGAMFRTTATP
jgi:hypothetical protein